MKRIGEQCQRTNMPTHKSHIYIRIAEEQQHPPVEYYFSGQCDDITTNRLFYYAENAGNRFSFPFSSTTLTTSRLLATCVNADENEGVEMKVFFCGASLLTLQRFSFFLGYIDRLSWYFIFLQRIWCGALDGMSLWFNLQISIENWPTENPAEL